MIRSIRIPLLAAAVLLAASCGPRIDLTTVAGTSGTTVAGEPVPGTEGESQPAAAGEGTQAPGAVAPGVRAPAGAAATGTGTTGKATGAVAVDNGGATDVGVTGDSIVLGGSAAIGGALPGQFTPAVQGMAAYLRMVNEQGGVYGRRLLYHYHDDALNRDTYRDNVVHMIKEDKVFALAGGLSAVDDGGCGFTGDVPDIGTFALNYCRAQAKNFYSPMGSLKQGVYGGIEQWKWLKERYPFAKPAVEYLTIPISQDQGIGIVDALVRTLGLKSRDDIYQGAQQATQPDYNAEVLNLQGQGVDAVFTAMDLPSNVRLLRAMCQQSYRPKVVHFEISTYDGAFIEQVGKACLDSQNIFIRAPHLPFNTSDNSEMRLFLSSMKRYFPEAKPATFGLEGWLSGKLLVEMLRTAGPKITRAKLYDALNAARDWTGGGVIGPNTPAKRTIYLCNLMMRVEAGDFIAKSGFLCGSLYKSGDYTGPPVP